MSLTHSQSALGAYYRRLCGRLDKAKAAAHKLARLIYALLSKGAEYVTAASPTRRSAIANAPCTN